MRISDWSSDVCSSDLEPVIRTAVRRAMQELGSQFVLGRSIDEAAERARSLEAKGYTYSYDMLGEAARTEADARRYHIAYSQANSAIAAHCTHGDIRAHPGIAVKLSALHPRHDAGPEPPLVDRAVPPTPTETNTARG